MRNAMLGSISIIGVFVCASAWGAPDDPPPATSASPAAPKSAAGASSAAPPSSAAPASAAPPASSAAPAPATTPAAPASSALSTAPSNDAPAPKPLTGPIAGPLPADSTLPPLPSAGYDTPPPPPPPRSTRRSEWGLQLRLEGAALGSNAASDAAMGGFGVSLRPRPSPHFAIDFGLDFLGGRDFVGDRRSETAFTVNPMVFLNPGSKVQIYLFAGLGVGGARVERGNALPRHYRYVGADVGGGVEFRLWQRFAFSGDVLAFVRDRSDLTRGPEFVDAATGRYTNSSAGALVRLGATYYW